MADIKTESMPTTSMPLPPPPQFAGAPGQQQYENNSTTNGQGNPAHMPPPPLPPVVIPQNTNPIPTAMTSPGGDSTGMMSPSSGSGSFVRRAAPEPNKRALYVGGLDPRVTEDILRQIFETTGHVQNVKIIPDKNMGAVSKAIAILRLLNTLDFSILYMGLLCCAEELHQPGSHILFVCLHGDTRYHQSNLPKFGPQQPPTSL